MSPDWIAERLRASADLKCRVANEQAAAILGAGAALTSALRRGGKILLFGNGGSAADAQHLAAEFVGRFLKERRPWPALALTTDTSALTAIGNDYGFDQVFARQVQALGLPGDVAIGISTSGRSPNVLAAVALARQRGLTTIGLTSGDGGPLAGAVDFPLIVPSTDTPRVQECHLTMGHVLCEMVEAALETSDGGENIRPEALPPVHAQKVVEWTELVAWRWSWRAAGKTVVWTNGCFDLLHAGHLQSLRAARALGDVLVVGVNGDESVHRLKGPSRPIVPAVERAELLAGLQCVDAVVVFEELTPDESLGKLQPDVHCKGSEYAPPHGKPVPEAALVESYGGRVAYLPMRPGVSTTDLVIRVHQRLAQKSPKAIGRRAVFLDRDGTLIRDTVYPRDPAAVELLPGAVEALAALKREDYALVVVSNQSGIGRGLITPDEACQFHERFASLFADRGITFDAVEYCPHGPEVGCSCRKPAPGMLLRAADRLGIDLGRSWLVGDKTSDYEAGKRAGCRPLRFVGDWDKVVAEIHAERETNLI